MKITRRQLRRLILKEVRQISENPDPAAPVTGTQFPKYDTMMKDIDNLAKPLRSAGYKQVRVGDYPDMDWDSVIFSDTHYENHYMLGVIAHPENVDSKLLHKVHKIGDRGYDLIVHITPIPYERKVSAEDMDHLTDPLMHQGPGYKEVLTPSGLENLDVTATAGKIHLHNEHSKLYHKIAKIDDRKYNMLVKIAQKF